MPAPTAPEETSTISRPWARCAATCATSCSICARSGCLRASVRMPVPSFTTRRLIFLSNSVGARAGVSTKRGNSKVRTRPVLLGRTTDCGLTPHPGPLPVEGRGTRWTRFATRTRLPPCQTPSRFLQACDFPAIKAPMKPHSGLFPQPIGPAARSAARFSRRDALKSSLAAGAAALVGGAATTAAAADTPSRPDPRRASPKRHAMKKSINLWAFPYPDRMNLRECLQLAKDAGFDGIELNYDLDNDLSPKHGTRDCEAIRKMADQIGIAISGLCSFLFWPYPLTSNDESKRARGLELAGKIAQAAHDLGVQNALVVPGAVHIPWRTDHEPVPND